MLNELDWKVLLAYADCDMNAERAAKQLHMARGTVCYHLDKIRDETKYSPYVFYDLIELVQIANAKFMITVSISLPLDAGSEIENINKLEKILSEMKGNVKRE